jgi:uncharacterized protein (TIGR03435 family)
MGAYLEMKYYMVCGILLSALVNGQESVRGPSFEVASVKLDDNTFSVPAYLTGPSEMNMRFQRGPGTRSPERIDYRGVTLRMLIQRAYEVIPEQVAGPEWLDKQRYTIAARLPPHATQEQSRLMLRELLNERFDLRFHRETRILPVYRLLVSKKGPKLKQTAPVRVPDNEQDQREAASAGLAEMTKEYHKDRGFQLTTMIYVPSAPMAEFIARVSQYVDRPVIDRTQLDQCYRFNLAWVAAGTRQAADAPRGPSIFEAIEEQLGLELQPAKDPLQMFVIDSARKAPVEN